MSIKKFREPKGETIHDDLNSANEVVGRYFFVQRAGERSRVSARQVDAGGDGCEVRCGCGVFRLAGGGVDGRRGALRSCQGCCRCGGVHDVQLPQLARPWPWRSGG